MEQLKPLRESNEALERVWRDLEGQQGGLGSGSDRLTKYENAVEAFEKASQALSDLSWLLHSETDLDPKTNVRLRRRSGPEVRPDDEDQTLLALFMKRKLGFDETAAETSDRILQLIASSQDSQMESDPLSKELRTDISAWHHKINETIKSVYDEYMEGWSVDLPQIISQQFDQLTDRQQSVGKCTD